jgi:hypothetical protein
MQIPGTSNPAAAAAQHQASSAGYTSDDSWVNTLLEPGFKIWRGVGGPYTPYHIGPNEMGGTLSGMPGASFWQNAQVRPHREKGYRDEITEYEVLVATPAAHALCCNNMSLGWGGAEQYFIPESHMNNLSPTGRTLGFS